MLNLGVVRMSEGQESYKSGTTRAEEALSENGSRVVMEWRSLQADFERRGGHYDGKPDTNFGRTQP